MILQATLRVIPRLRFGIEIEIGVETEVGAPAETKSEIENEVGVEVGREIEIEVWGGELRRMRCLRLRFSMVLRLRFLGCN